MKNFNLNDDGFINWLKNNYHYYVGDKNNRRRIKFKTGSASNYKKYLTLAIIDLGINSSTFKYSSPGLLFSFLKKLEELNSFQKRDLKTQSNIISAFRAFIAYKDAIA